LQEALNERVKHYRTWKEDEVNLAKKREIKVRLELAHKNDKIADAAREITEVCFKHVLMTRLLTLRVRSLRYALGMF